jgi:inorganic pyrophosphatase
MDNFDFENSFSNDSIADFIDLKEKFFEMKQNFIDNYVQYERVF